MTKLNEMTNSYWEIFNKYLSIILLAFMTHLSDISRYFKEVLNNFVKGENRLKASHTKSSFHDPCFCIHFYIFIFLSVGSILVHM